MFIKEDEQEKALENLSNAPWFKSTMEISQLLRDKQNKDAPPFELLFDIDGTRLLTTVHEKAKTKDIQKKNAKVIFDLRSSDSNGDSESSSKIDNSSKDSDEDSTSSHYNMKRSDPQATIGVERAPLALERVHGSAQGLTLGG